jgi:site-specific DNA recombinase
VKKDWLESARIQIRRRETNVTQREWEKTAFAYVRVSSEEQVDGLSLESQEVKIRQWCEQKGFELVRVFRDEGKSAFTDDIKKRPQFAALLSHLATAKPDTVVVYSMDRWARSMVVASESFRRLAELGVGLASVTEQQFDFSNAASGLHLNLLAIFAQYQSQTTGQHVRRVNDLKFEKGLHRGAPPFGYVADPSSTRADPKPPMPFESEFSAVQEVFRRLLTGRETYRTLAKWLNDRGFRTRNRQPTAAEADAGGRGSPRRFTEESVRSIVTNPFYAGFVVKEHRTKSGAGSPERSIKQGLHVPAVTPDEFNRVQSIIRSHQKAPRSASPRLRPYLGRGLIHCIDCGEKAWCHTIKGVPYYQESSASRGVACTAPGRYWTTENIDSQIGRIVKPVALPADWRARAVELANAENNILELRQERTSLERRRRRLVELYKDDMIDRVEFEREIDALDNRLKTTLHVDVQFAEVTVQDFEEIRRFWDPATPEERAALLGRLAEKFFVDFDTGQVLEIVPRIGFRYVLEAAQIVRSPAGPFDLTIGDPEGIRTPDLHRDRVAC